MAANAAAVLEALPLAAAARRRRVEQAQRDALPTSPLAWAARHRKIDGRPFSLDRFAPLRALYEDDHPHICVIKSAQKGVSEWALNYTAFALDRGAAVWSDGFKDGLNVAYILPTKEALGDFSKERITGLERESPYLERMFDGDDDFNAVTFKQVGGSYLYLRGGWSTSALKTFPADVLVLDEFDEIAPSAVALARRRLNASVVRRELDVSTPTVPGRGIHALYLQSDRRVYEQRHSECGAWVRYDFLRDARASGEPYEAADGGWKTWPPEQLRRATIALACPVCREPVSDADRCAEGRWVAEQPEVTGLRGYWIPPLAFPFVDLTALAVAAVSQDPSELTEFYRSDLGLPYEPAGSKVTSAMLAQLSHALPGGLLPDVAWRDTTMGVDVGSRFHYRVSAADPDGVVHVRAMGAVGSWDELDGLMATYGVRQCVTDALPELHACQAWAAKHPGKVLRAFYPTAAALKGQLLREDRDAGVVQVNRTMAMDAVYAAVAGAEERWPAAVHNDPEVVAHMTAPVRVTTTDAHGQAAASWVHTAPDHGFHACLVAGTLVRTEHGEQPIETIRPGVRVWTRQGLRRVLAAGLTARDADVVTYRFSDGSTLTGTPNHPVHTETRGFVPLHSTVYDDIITAWSGWKRSSIAASCSAATRTVPDGRIGSTTRREVESESAASSAFTRKSGKTSTALFQRGTSSTIETRIPSTTIRLTSSVSQRAATGPSIRASNGRQGRTSTASAPSLMRGGAPRRAVRGTATTPVVRSWPSSRASTSASTAASPSWPSRPPRRARAAPARTPATARPDERLGSMTKTGRASFAVRRTGSIAIGRFAPAPWRAARSSRVRPSGRNAADRADVFNLSVDGAEEYFANGLLVHNCVYDRVAREALPSVRPARPAAGGTRPTLDEYRRQGMR